jgi:pimeloyl-ACP methyl ester carboxylesterase
LRARARKEAGGRGRTRTGSRPERERDAEGFVDCPDCDKQVKMENIESHLRRVHSYPPDEARRFSTSVQEAGEMANRTIRTAFILFFILLAMSIVIVLSYQGLMRDDDDGNGDDRVYETVHFRTSDGWDIFGDYYPPATGRSTVLLVHGFNEDRKAYSSFAMDLYEDGFGVLSIDSRGHGSSTVKDGKVVVSLSQDDVAAMTNDLVASIDYLGTRGGTDHGVTIIGASVGANIAMIHAVNDTSVRAVVLLSPGESYRGIQPMDAIRRYTGDMLLVVGPLDGYAYASCAKFLENATEAKVVDLFEGEGANHGTNLLKDEAQRKKVIGWVKENMD